MDEWSLPGYTSLRELGRGGFGRVVLARHEGSGRLVAVKYLSVQDERFRTELRTEAGVLRGLDDPHVVRLHEYVETPRGSAIVMEAVDGVSLRAVLEEYEHLEPEAALAILKGSLLGLGAAHRVGIVHRDYKPANVMVDGGGQSKLIDFGIALRAGTAGKVAGTPKYMAPEQWAGSTASPSTDVYAATCVFFECVTGRTPYQGETTEAYRTQHAIGEIPAEEAPPGVRALIRRGLAKRPQERPAGALEFAAELEAAATAAYGPQWESNGWRRLAEAAAGLAALFPFAALVSSVAPAGHVAGAAAGKAGAAAGKAAAATGRGVLTKTLGTNAATKAVALATGVIVVGGAGATAIIVNRHTPKPKHLRVELVSYNRAVAGLDLSASRYVRVNGVKDPAVQRRVNAALAGPLDWAAEVLRQQTAQFDPPCTKPTYLNARPEVGLRGPRLVTVRYELAKQTCVPLDYELPHVTVTVDARTGKELTADQVFRPATLTPDGLATLWKRVLPHTTQPDLRLVCVNPPLLRKDFFPGEPLTGAGREPPHISPFLTPTGLAMTWSHSGSECPYYPVTVPYAEVRDLLDPKIVAELPT